MTSRKQFGKMMFWKRIKENIKIKLATLIKVEWLYIKKLDSIKNTNCNSFVPNNFLLYDFVMKEELKEKPIRYFEFGVFDGISFKHWVDNYSSRESEFYGFDTFTGLPEDWNKRKKGSYSTYGKVPEIKDTRVEFIKGLFQETLPGFLSKQREGNKINILHLDADLYSSTLFVLSSFLPFLKKDDILIFDEFGIELNHEFRAFMDFVDMSKIKYQIICSTKNYVQTAIKIL